MDPFTFCTPCRNAGRVTRAKFCIDAVPTCVRCICGERPRCFEPLTPEPRLLRKPPIQPLYLGPLLATPNGTAIATQAPALSPPIPLRVKDLRCWELRQTQTAALVSQVVQATEFEFALEPGSLRRRTNQLKFVQPRQLAMLLLHTAHQRSLCVIGRAFAKHHTTVLHSVRAAQARLVTDVVFAEHAKRIADSLERIAQDGTPLPTSWFQQQARRDSDLIREMKNVASLVRGFTPANENSCNAEQAGAA